MLNKKKTVRGMIEKYVSMCTKKKKKNTTNTSFLSNCYVPVAIDLIVHHIGDILRGVVEES